MTAQRSAFGSSTCSLPRTIAFILPGRRTLSEHLPAEMINVPIALAQRSKYLRKVIAKHALESSTERQIRLANIDSIGFRMYIDWLEGGEFRTASTLAKGSLLLRDSFDYIFAHIAGSQLEDPDFQDYIIDAMEWLLNASQTPDLKVLEVAFLEEGASETLKQFVVDKMFAVERKMLTMMRGVNISLDGRTQSDAGCRYHVHEKERCYKTDANRRHANTANYFKLVHEEWDLRNVTRHDIHSTRSSSSTSLASDTQAKAVFYNMANTQYFGFGEWSHKVHGLRQRTRTPNLHTNKPLPTIPTTMSGTSTTPPSPPDSLRIALNLVPTGSNYNTISTEQLIHKCLSRLPPDNPSLIHHSDHAPPSHRTEIDDLVLECMQRFQRTSSTDSPSPHPSCSPGSSSPTQFPHSGTPSPLVERRVHWEKSFESLPKPWLDHVEQLGHGTRITELKQIYSFTSLQPHTHHPVSISHSRHSPLSTPPNLVKRKPAPPRGDDWLKQYDRINGLRKDGPLVVAKRSKKSRFKEMLRSESGLGKGD
jgi:hypothetical protein